MERSRIDAFLVTDLANVRYLSGFDGSSAAILVTKQGPVFITDFRYQEYAGRLLAAAPWRIVIERGDRVRLIRGMLKDAGAGVLGFETTVSYAFYRSLAQCRCRLRPVAGTVEALREVKDREELRLIREAVLRAEGAFNDIRPFVRPGQRERQIAGRLEERLKKRGCRHAPFDIIVASGSNGAMPHARTTDKKLVAGELVVIDWGGEADGYNSDLTRTLLLRSGNTARQQQIYEVVLSANRKAIAAVRPGLRADEVDGVARGHIGKAGYGEYFGHGTGHGVGLEVHEAPRISWTAKGVLREGMVFTVEPGIYLPGVGGVRIEDMVRVVKGRPQVLTSLPKHLEII